MSDSTRRGRGTKRSYPQTTLEEKSFKKVINDPIHGHIEIPELCVRIMDTPQYQRLRHIKQLGAAYYVYPGAAHNRFEHGIGVCHLAGKFVRQLKENDPTLPITKRDIRCVEIAGLCHDLGHGPFSHAFERYFIDVLAPEEEWSHEKASLEMFDYLIDNNDAVWKAFYDEFNMKDEDRNFIKRLISKDKVAMDKTGRSEDKDFLYEIVANGENGIDVDKFDYFARDCYYLGYKNSFSHERLMKFARVIEVTEEEKKRGDEITKIRKKHICFREKEVENIYDLFYQRTLLHHRTCQHKTARIIEIMYMEALREANKYLKVKSDGDKYTKISKTIGDMAAYTNLTDGIFERILRPTEENALRHGCLQKAYALLDRVEKRDHYKLVGEASAKQRQRKGTSRPTKEFEESVDGETELAIAIAKESDGDKLREEDLVVNVVNFNYGKKWENPVDRVYFYNKSDEKKAKKLHKDEVSEMLPSVFFEQHVRVYSKENKNKDLVSTAFRKWCEKNDLVIIKDFGNMQQE